MVALFGGGRHFRPACRSARGETGSEQVVKSCSQYSPSCFRRRESVRPSAIRAPASVRDNRDTTRRRAPPQEPQVSGAASGRGAGGSEEATGAAAGWPATRNSEFGGSPWAERP